MEPSKTEGRDLFAEAGIQPVQSQARDLFAEAGIQPASGAEKFVNQLPKEIFQRSHPVAQLAIGASKPIAGALQFAGINEPAKFLNRLSERFEEEGQTPLVSQGLDIAGQVVSPIPSKVASVGAKALPQVANYVSTAGRYIPMAAEKIGIPNIVKYGGQGAGAALLTPTTGKEESYADFLGNKATQLAEGFGLGAGLGKAGQMIMNPEVSANLQKLKDMGMKYFTPAQLMGDIPVIGKGMQAAEKAATSIPIAGNLIQSGLQNVNKDFNKAMVNQVLAPMKMKLASGVEAGEDMMRVMNDAISNAYDQITPFLNLRNKVYKDPTSPQGFTTTVKSFMDKLNEVTAGLPSAKGNNQAGMVKDEFKKLFLDPLDSQMGLSGEAFRNAEKNLGRVAYNYIRNPATYDVGVALRELQGELRHELTLQNPKLAEELKGIHLAFRRHLPIEQAASYVGAQNRVFTPGQLESGIKAKGGKNAFLQGTAPLYPESQAALDVLGRNVPDSGTAQRALVGAGLLNIPGIINALPAIAGSAAFYNRPVMGALTKLATERPEAMKKLQPQVSSTLAKTAGVSTND